MSELVNEHKRTYDDDTMRNLTDVYLKQIKESNDPNFNGKYDKIDQSFSRGQMRQFICLSFN